MIVDRTEELAFLNQLLTRTHPTAAQLVLMYGRRRVGKTELLIHWAKQSGLPYTYWSAVKESAAMQRNRLFAQLLNVPEESAPVHRSWQAFWAAVAAHLQDKRHILIFDELPYAADADPSMLSSLQHAWDHTFQKSNTVLVLCGSHVHVMETLMTRQSPLFGRMTAQWYLEPLPYASLKAFYPKWSAAERVAAYAVAGGIPAYLGWLNPAHSLTKNIRDVILSPGGMFLAEPAFLLSDEVREPSHYLAILKAIGSGNHTLNDISNFCYMSRTSINAYLSALQELRLVQRRLPATLKPGMQAKSRNGRYHFCDPYFRFYFQFIAPFASRGPIDADQVLAYVTQNLRAFVGLSAFEEICREWTRKAGKTGKLGFTPEAVGSHWSSKVQVDVAAVNWQTRDLLLGECKWGTENINRQVVRDLVENKTPLILKDMGIRAEEWRIHYALFGRTGFTAATEEEMQLVDGRCLALEELDADLSG